MSTRPTQVRFDLVSCNLLAFEDSLSASTGRGNSIYFCSPVRSSTRSPPTLSDSWRRADESNA